MTLHTSSESVMCCQVWSGLLDHLCSFEDQQQMLELYSGC